ncbi:TNF receptor-associated factor 6 [Rhipicephalus sanguineus]|uniref:TNF receptor-associated factor 6 n=1 Tax=Rhipicephalus sanguineus TaxID=34632 RepID=UPI0018958E57|nr:TNF receptor-associated factor 6 [Rhipicephalus sanguineus]
MPTPRHRHTLLGFSDALDWRALNFVDPIPPNIVCKACGLVTRVTAFLPCLHVFCKKCYEQCSDDDVHCCPLDGQRAVKEDVQWIEYPVRNLLKRKVKCWNEDRGCDKVHSASELHKHFCKDCDYHSTSCPGCSMVVRCNNVCAHMQSECRDGAVLLASGNPQTISACENALTMALNVNIDTRAGEMKERLDHLTQENHVQGNRLNEISHCMNVMKETLQEISSRSNRFDSIASCSEAIYETLNDHGEKLQQLAGTISNSHEKLNNALEGTKLSVEQLKEDTASTLSADFKEFFSGEGGALTVTLRRELKNATRTICSACAETVAKIVEVQDCEKQNRPSTVSSEKTLALSTINVKKHEFFVEGFKAKRENALSDGYCAYEEKKTYISGYHLSPGVSFKLYRQNVYLHPRIQLHKGIIDNVLEWPFKKTVRLTIKHPTQKKECRKQRVPRDSPDHYEKPDKASNTTVFFDDVSFALDNLEREGYITDDRLRVVWELVSDN